mmetsp:Transcript_108063/g.345101  ORF Transcript_108063/g.345101 Transcript_108063/m.345101 type:complete len:251 (-) Transcript_108063:7145-7897(-)
MVLLISRRRGDVEVSENDIGDSGACSDAVARVGAQHALDERQQRRHVSHRLDHVNKRLQRLAEGIDIRFFRRLLLWISHVVLAQFRCHKAVGPTDQCQARDAGALGGRTPQLAPEFEVAEQRPRVAIHEHIFRFDVAMDEACAVDVLHRHDQLSNNTLQVHNRHPDMIRCPCFQVRRVCIEVQKPMLALDEKPSQWDGVLVLRKAEFCEPTDFPHETLHAFSRAQGHFLENASAASVHAAEHFVSPAQLL